MIRKLWDAGLAHRDIKPANLLVRDGQVLVIDVAFMQVRPSPWRQAVDLANMMLVLAVRTDARRVYDRALQFFTAGRDRGGVRGRTRRGQPDASSAPSMKQDGRDLLAEFRAMAPARRPDLAPAVEPDPRRARDRRRSWARCSRSRRRSAC